MKISPWNQGEPEEPCIESDEKPPGISISASETLVLCAVKPMETRPIGQSSVDSTHTGTVISCSSTGAMSRAGRGIEHALSILEYVQGWQHSHPRA